MPQFLFAAHDELRVLGFDVLFDNEVDIEDGICVKESANKCNPIRTTRLFLNNSRTILTTRTTRLFLNNSRTILTTRTTRLFLNNSHTILTTRTTRLFLNNSHTILTTRTTRLFLNNSHTILTTRTTRLFLNNSHTILTTRTTRPRSGFVGTCDTSAHSFLTSIGLRCRRAGNL